MITQDDPEDQARDWVLRLNAPGADAALRAEFNAWRLRSTANQMAWEKCQHVLQLMSSLSPADIRELDPPSRRGRPKWRWTAALAASLVAAVILCLVAPTPGVWFADEHTRPGEQRKLTLEDGSRIELNGSTALSFSLNTDLREVDLATGEASFEVAHDGRSFVVHAGETVITVTGTRFDVLRIGDRVRLRVAQGHVLAARSGETPLHVGVGESVMWRPGNAPAIGQSSDSEMTAWSRGLIVFREQPLSEVVDELSLYRRGRFFFLSDRARTQVVTGVFDPRRPDAIVDAIEQNLQVRVTHLTPWLTLIR